MAGDRLAQRRKAERRRVVDIARRDRALRSVDHRLRRREIGLADLHVNDVAPGRFQRPRGRLHLHHVERLDVGDATGDEDPGVHRKSEWRSGAKAVS